MNEFIDQFLFEAAELIEQGTTDLLELERHPADRERLNGAFRAFHTLKGCAGIIEFDALSRAMHAAESALADARSGVRAVTTQLISRCLACLDQVEQWLETFRKSGRFPESASEDADLIVAEFGSKKEARERSPTIPTLQLSILQEQLALLRGVEEFSPSSSVSAARVASNVLRELNCVDGANLSIAPRWKVAIAVRFCRF